MYEEEEVIARRSFVWVLVVLFLFFSAVGTLSFVLTRSVEVVDNGIVHYEEFQEIYNTCQKINTDLGVLRQLPADDKMFSQFSKSAIIAQKQQQLTRWTEEYNAKSRMWNRALWKSKSLPYQLDATTFSNFGQ